MNAWASIRDLTVLFGVLVLLPLGAMKVTRWDSRQKRRQLNLAYGRSLSKRELKRAKAAKARKDRQDWWRRVWIALTPARFFAYAREGEEHREDEAVLARLRYGLTEAEFAVFLELLVSAGVLGGIEGDPGPVGRVLSGVVLLYGLVGAVACWRMERPVRDFQNRHLGRSPGEDPDHHHVQWKKRQWEHKAAFQRGLLETGLSPRALRREWRRNGWM